MNDKPELVDDDPTLDDDPTARLQGKVIELQAELGAAKAQLSHQSTVEVELARLQAHAAELEAQLEALAAASPSETDGDDTSTRERLHVPKDVEAAASAERRRRRELKLMATARLVSLIMRFDGRTRTALVRLPRAVLEDTVIQGEKQLRAAKGAK